ncbi:J domain-containing protein [Curtobacterium sp. MCBD17_040]|uniref:J domain-containing protein n=1 Tax=Curtobacterium sp. MCBD17_040 TaxID=2175674 RepID=UPI000DAA88E2|nr:J domain-containing protein [Curtobacterium sp. MCBD17_040]WIB65685.1 J domain-containing protein [Curtobacterium sp. MCBD17_040]
MFDATTTAYSTLGISETATYDDIVKAHRTLMRAFHPDINPNADQEQAKLINEAFDTLKTDDARAAYDATLANDRAYAASTADTDGDAAAAQGAATETPMTSRDDVYVPAGDRFSFASAGAGTRSFRAGPTERAENAGATSRAVFRTLAGLTMVWGVWFLLQQPHTGAHGMVTVVLWPFAVVSIIRMFRTGRWVLNGGLGFGALIWPLAAVHAPMFTWFTSGFGWQPFAAMTVLAVASMVFRASRPATSIQAPEPVAAAA